MLEVNTFGDYQAGIAQITDTSRLVISLSGFGPANGEIPFESVHSLKSLTLNPCLIYVKDNSRSWYTNKNGFDDLITFLKEFISQNKISDISVFGISMGGFGAVLLANKLNANRAIALSPRTLIGPKCTFDSRNKEYMDHLFDIEVDDMRDLLSENSHVTVLYSIDDPFDAAHAARLKDTSAKVLAFRGEHNIAKTLKSKGRLDKFMEACITNKLAIEDYGFFIAPSELLLLSLNKLLPDSVPTANQVLKEMSPEHIPDYLYRDLQSIWIAKHFSAPYSKQVPYESATAYPAHPFLTAEGPRVSPYLGIGWAGPENFGVWADGVHHTLKLRMTSMPANGEVRISIALRTFSDERAPKIIAEYHCNGELPVKSETSGLMQVVTFLATEPYVEITIYTPNAVRPAELGISGDKRMLSVAILGITIEPSEI
jgi:hypothetical protein